MRSLKILSVVITAIALALFVVTNSFQIMGRDPSGPVINMESDRIDISVSDDKNSILTGVTAQDAKDGDVTSSLVVENISNFVGTGERIASIAAFDSDNHVTKVERLVHYTDYKKPHFSLGSPLSVSAGSKITVLTSKLSATDCMDGDITNKIRRTNAEGSNFNIDNPGIYKMIFSVSNNAGDMEKFEASVEVYDKTDSNLPNVSLTDAMIYLSKEAQFDPLSYLKKIGLDGTIYQVYNGQLVSNDAILQIQRGELEGSEIPEEAIYPLERVTIQNPVDTETPGWYEVSYSVSAPTGEVRSAFLLVRVED